MMKKVTYIAGGVFVVIILIGIISGLVLGG